ncbi:MAG: HypC/HybG/HupF family hydrogenase formation chaperone [Euryarchaeota archaeon]|nr:HypC/HybG/HupF family hydrogenase formation chaperone [Euryarchaeota archaeon]
MCLAVPGKVVKVKGSEGLVDFGGAKRWVNISLVDAKAGSYVIVHAGFAIQTLGKREALETIALWAEMLDKMGEDVKDA